MLEAFYNEFEEKVNNSDNKIEVIVDGIESVLKEETKIERLLITVISQAQVNKKLQKILGDFWSKILNLITTCYMNEYENLTMEQASLKARLLVSSAIESIVEKILKVEFPTDNQATLIREAAEKLGEE